MRWCWSLCFMVFSRLSLQDQAPATLCDNWLYDIPFWRASVAHSPMWTPWDPFPKTLPDVESSVLASGKTQTKTATELENAHCVLKENPQHLEFVHLELNEKKIFQESASCSLWQKFVSTQITNGLNKRWESFVSGRSPLICKGRMCVGSFFIIQTF